MNKLSFSAALFFILHTAPALAVSYECEDGSIQSTPCEGVEYSRNLTAPSRYAGSKVSLSDSLAATAAAKESIGQHTENLANYNQQLQNERNAQWQHDEYLHKAQQYRNSANAWRSYGLRVAPVNDDARASEYERKARAMEE